MEKPLPVAAGQPGEVDVPPSEGHEVADCGHIVRWGSNQNIKLSEQEGRGREDSQRAPRKAPALTISLPKLMWILRKQAHNLACVLCRVRMVYEEVL